jgi:hypothetical protein
VQKLGDDPTSDYSEYNGVPGLIIHDGVDVAGAELDKNLTEQMPPFVVTNYIIKI